MNAGVRVNQNALSGETFQHALDRGIVRAGEVRSRAHIHLQPRDARETYASPLL